MKQIQHLPDLIDEMNQKGVTQDEMQNTYGLTQYGAEKLCDTISHDRSRRTVEGAGENPYEYRTDYTSEDLPKSIGKTQIPVKTNHTELTRETQHKKQSQTNDVKEYLTGLEEMVKSVETPVIEWSEEPEHSENSIDVIWHETDTHLGAKVEDQETGEVVFDTETVQERMYDKRKRFSKYLAEQAEDNNVEVIHWLLGGDIIEGTGIYGGQSHETDKYINEQIEAAGEELVKTYKLLYEEAKMHGAHLQIVCMPGNHGDMRISSANNKASFDDLVYHVLHQAIKMHQEDQGPTPGVRVKRSDTYVGTTFPLRNMTGYLTHGQHLKQHVGTASGQRDALSIMNEYDADVIFRGHYHMPKIEDVNGVPVVMTNSIKPGGMYEDSIRAYGSPGYAFYTASDGNPVKDATFYRTG